MGFVMKDICSRARGAMSLLLVIALLQLWVYLPGEGSKARIRSDLTEIVGFLKEADAAQLSANQKAFLNGYGELELEREEEDTTVKTIWEMDEKSIYLPGPSRVDDAAIERILGVVDALRRLKDAIRLSNVNPESAVLADVENKLAQDIEAPVIKVKLASDKASIWLSAAAFLIMIYLTTLIDSIWLILKDIPPEATVEPLDLILFYKSLWSYFLGGLWLVAPPLLSMELIRHAAVQSRTYLTLSLIVMPISMIFLIIRVIIDRVSQIRDRLYKNPPTGTGKSSTSDSDTDNDDESDLAEGG